MTRLSIYNLTADVQPEGFVGGGGVEPILNCDVTASGQFSFRPCIRVSGDCDLCGENCGIRAHSHNLWNTTY